MIIQLLDFLKESTKDLTKNYSHTKISSYFILGSILSTTIVYLCIDVINAYINWSKDLPYVIPVEHIGVFALILSHHLVILGLKNASDKTKIESGKFELGPDTSTDDKTGK